MGIKITGNAPEKEMQAYVDYLEKKYNRKLKSLEVTIDGEFGENTAYAVTRLQKKAGMKNINFGTVSSKTWLLLID